MKKKYLILVLICFVMTLNAKEISLYNDDMDIVTKFENLSMEDQYRSYINSFRYVGDTRNRQLYWAQCLAKYGRELLPLIDDDIKDSNFNNLYRQPFDDVLGLISYILEYMDRKNILTNEDIIKYKELYEKKLDDYVLEFRIIDGTVGYGIICVEDFTNGQIYLPREANYLKSHYEKKLGITGIIAGNIRSTWEY